MTKTWDGDSFRRGVASEAVSAKRYADQLARELRQKPSKSKEAVRDQFLGETYACLCLDQTARADDRLDLIAFIENELMSAMPTDLEAGDQERFRAGYRGKLREIRARL